MKYTGIVHCHSSYSYDGKLPMAELKEFLKARGVSFVCMTEHTDTLDKETVEEFVNKCRELSDESFVFVPGLEVPYKHAHILLIGCSEFVCQYAKDANMLRQAAKNAQFVILAHPVRNHFETDEAMSDLINALEIWNQQYEGKHVPRTRSLALYDELLKKKPALLATGGVDFHRSEHFGSPLVSMELENLSEDTVMQALQNGAYTFGTKSVVINAHGEWNGKGSLKTRLQSALSVSVIVLGKTVNKLLAKLGIRLPKGFRQTIRKYI